jgi:hypothetical protein
MTVSVKRDGTVWQTTELSRPSGAPISHFIGRVEKRVSELAFSTRTLWFAFDSKGEPLGSQWGYETRKRALGRVTDNVAPLEVELEYENIYDLYQHDPVRVITGWVHQRGASYGISQRKGEDYWVVDFYARPGSIMPEWSNGTATRVTAGKVLGAELAAAVNAKAAELGLKL